MTGTTLTTGSRPPAVSAGTFAPEPWLRNRHLQTLLANRPLRWPRGPAVTDTRHELPDGDVVRLVRSNLAPGTALRARVVVLHGLAGGYDSAYGRELFRELASRGIEAHMLHFRGCGGLMNRLPRGYHAGDIADLSHYLEQVQRLSPRVPLAAVGFSLGANVLLKYLGESGEKALLDAAVGVSVPFDLQDACDSISEGFSRVYHKVLLDNLKQSMRERFSPGDAPFDLHMLRNISTLKQFDDVVTAPMHGFRDADHYYRQSSCRQYLGAISVPTLVLHARDDPFQSAAGIPGAGELSPRVRLELPEHGGHVGFLQAAAGGLGLRSWLHPRIADYLEEALGLTRAVAGDD